MMEAIHERIFIGSSNNRLVADVGGVHDAPAVVLLHGGGQTRHSWGLAQQELIQAGYRVVSVDSRGHGESDWIADGDYSLPRQVDDVKSIVRELGKPTALVGASQGGVISLLACGADPQLAQALVLVDVAPRLESEGVEHIHRFMTSHLHGFASIEEACDVVAGYTPARPRPRNPDGLRKNLRLKPDGRWYWHWDPSMFDGELGPKVAQMSQQMEQAARRIRIPTLLVRGQHSDVISDAGASELQAMMPHLELADIAGAGHMIAGDRNDVFNRAIAGFLQRYLPQ
ncbi:alpha/beta fold hydrolase [Herbaspirillum autotrophicum]|uniref:alpha/beta fold hydrolase n=1 Tax=Herbaspirillum autotrophicum TaxID=180195 RepID=UPI00067CD07C|nr:alpha/beta hydrolase [Herbaspirillum autotrophicum]